MIKRIIGIHNTSGGGGMSQDPQMYNAIDLTSRGLNNPYTLPSDGYIYVEGYGANTIVEIQAYIKNPNGQYVWASVDCATGGATWAARDYLFLRKGTTIKITNATSKLNNWTFIPYY